jgi:hypothetical protein
VELAPAILPAFPDLCDTGVREGGEDALRGRAVRGELDALGPLLLLEALRGELDEARPELLGLLEPGSDGDPDQWKTFFSFSKKPW